MLDTTQKFSHSTNPVLNILIKSIIEKRKISECIQNHIKLFNQGLYFSEGLHTD